MKKNLHLTRKIHEFFYLSANCCKPQVIVCEFWLGACIFCKFVEKNVLP
jgi:hypothetical protein